MIVNLKWFIWIETIIICHKRSLPVSRVTGKVASIWISNSTMKGDKSKQWNIKILLSSINNSQPLNYHRIIRLRVPKCNLLSKLKVKIRSLRSTRSPSVKAWERRSAEKTFREVRSSRWSNWARGLHRQKGLSMKSLRRNPKNILHLNLRIKTTLYQPKNTPLPRCLTRIPKEMQKNLKITKTSHLIRISLKINRLSWTTMSEGKLFLR